MVNKGLWWAKSTLLVLILSLFGLSTNLPGVTGAFARNAFNAHASDSTIARVNNASAQCVELGDTLTSLQLPQSMYHAWDPTASIKAPALNRGYELTETTKDIDFKRLAESGNEATLGANQSNHWLRFCLKNESSNTMNLVLAMSPPVMAEIDFYPQKKGLKSFKTGSTKKMSSRDIHSPDFHFNIALAPSEQQEFFIRVYATTNAYITAELWDRASYGVKKDWDESKIGVFVGVLVGLIIYNILLFISSRQSTSVLYIGWSLITFLLLASLDGRVHQYLLPNHPEIARALIYILYPLCNISAFMFGREFIKLSNYPVLDRIGKWLIALLTLLTIVAFQFGASWYFLCCALFVLIGIVYFGLFAPLYALIKHNSLASKHLLITQAPLMLCMIDQILFALGVTDGFYLPYTPKTGLILAMILVSYYIGSSIHNEKDEAQRLALEQLEISNKLKSSYNAELQNEIHQKTTDIRAMNLSLEKQASQLRDLDAAKSKFFANISHEFRTPLTLIEGPLTMLLERDGFAEKEIIAGAVRNSKSLQHLINQLLLLSEFDENTARLAASKTDVVKAVSEYAAQFDSLLQQRGISLKIDAQQPSINAYVDSEKLQIIINNLLSNAIKFSGASGQISIKLSSSINKGVAIDDLSSDEYLEILVSDTGPGIPESELPYVFDRYFQSESSDLSKSGLGTGIGLALVKELVNLHAGQVSVVSQRRSESKARDLESKIVSGIEPGTAFSVKLPLGRAHLTDSGVVEHEESDHEGKEVGYSDSKANQSSLERLASGAAPTANPAPKPTLGPVSNKEELPPVNEEVTVLVVDDNEDMRNYISRLLETDYHVITAVDGLMAEKALKRHSPNIIITDLMMPNRDGLELVELLKKDNQFSKIPVIMLTARAGLNDRISGLMAAVDDYLVKPFNARELKVRIKNLLDKQAQFRAFYTNQGSETGSLNAYNAEKDDYIEKVRAIVNERLADTRFGVDDLAEALHVSEATLRRKLTEKAKSTPAAFIRHCRLEKARQLSEQGNMRSLAELANAVGFSQPSYFARLYQKTFNAAPMA